MNAIASPVPIAAVVIARQISALRQLESFRNSIATGTRTATLPTARGRTYPADVVLGKKNLVPYGKGWGTSHPQVIFNGGDPSGRAWNLHWREWGHAVARAQGLTWIFTNGDYVPGAIEVLAYRIGRCNAGGPPAYTHLIRREAVRPGGPLGRWLPWGGWRSICRWP